MNCRRPKHIRRQNQCWIYESNNAQTGEYEGLVKVGVLDPTKVVRTAVTNAGSISSLMLTTEASVSEIPEEMTGAPMPGVNPNRNMLLRPKRQECINQVVSFDAQEQHFAG
jgi:hypothetical protein